MPKRFLLMGFFPLYCPELPAPCSLLFYHPIRPRQHIRSNRKADQLRRFKIDDEHELRSTSIPHVQSNWGLARVPFFFQQVSRSRHFHRLALNAQEAAASTTPKFKISLK